ncbi:hypothetical protein FA95DRAFT_1049204 [Auriscalpium vulgare]|uniref:Uncharacterized protein n=1 Tax=Auriscalpium vulgare TaxID=40419 RepID=A0ACB8S914_9AGAM|nr:hypothetical protein FA95DRAFT_1049204 [Auriscalpium vulgare]
MAARGGALVQPVLLIGSSEPQGVSSDPTLVPFSASSLFATFACSSRRLPDRRALVASVVLVCCTPTCQTTRAAVRCTRALSWPRAAHQGGVRRPSNDGHKDAMHRPMPASVTSFCTLQQARLGPQPPALLVMRIPLWSAASASPLRARRTAPNAGAIARVTAGVTAPAASSLFRSISEPAVAVWRGCTGLKLL